MKKRRGNSSHKELKKLSKKILKVLKNSPSKAFTRKQIIKSFQSAGSRDEITRAIFYLVSTERVSKSDDNRFQYIQHSSGSSSSSKPIVRYVEGIVDLAPSGVAYILVDGIEDVRVERDKTAKAMDGDKVKVGLYKTKNANRPKGEVISIIERNQEYFVGTVQLGNGFAFVLPDKQSMNVDFFINSKHINDAKEGDKVIVQFLGWPENNKNPDGKITEILGKKGLHDVEMKSILVEHNFPLSFPKGIQKELDAISTKISKEEVQVRKDIRSTLTFTIDPVDAKDFDDAISYKELDNGLIEIGVHIADVSHYVQPNTILDKSAYRRATSVYLVDRVLPMLPEKLSNVICSLRPDEDSLCFSVFFTINDKAEVRVIHSHRRFTYDEALEEIKSGEGQFGKPLKRINDIAKTLRKKRYDNGAIDFDSREIRFTLNLTGDIEAVKAKERHDAHYLIEEFMLLANKTVAKFMAEKRIGKNKFPFLYRIHDEPDPEKLAQFRMNAADYGHSINTDDLKKLPFELNKFFAHIKGKPEQDSLEGLAIRSMAKAIYTTENIGHYGLHFEHYSHFTSPIRRYPDLLVHRQIQDFLTKQTTKLTSQDLEDKCGQCNKMERKAVEAERQSIKYYQTIFMKDKVGQEFTGFVSGVTSWGFYVELDNIHTEGLVRIQDLTDDDYAFDERKKQIVGFTSGNTFHLGKKVKVLVDAVNVEKRQIDLLWITEED